MYSFSSFKIAFLKHQGYKILHVFVSVIQCVPSVLTSSLFLPVMSPVSLLFLTQSSPVSRADNLNLSLFLFESVVFIVSDILGSNLPLKLADEAHIRMFLGREVSFCEMRSEMQSLCLPAITV